MPEGIESVVEDGIAVIEFRDPSKRGPALSELFKHAPADQVRKTTRPVAYHVPEGYARAAGLLDEATSGSSDDQAPEVEVVQTWPDGDPSDDWQRHELDDYALGVHKLDTSDLKNKGEVLKTIADEKAKAEAGA